MRIREEYKKSGYFWLPDNEGEKVPGTLTIMDGGEIELELVGPFEKNIKAPNEKGPFNRILGLVEKDGLVTLERCFYKRKSFSFGGISKSILHADQVLSGVAYEKDGAITFNTVSFAVEGLNEWLGITGISVSYGDDYKTATISYKPQSEIVYSLDNGLKLHIYFGYTLPGFANTTEAKITQQAYFKLSSNEAKELPVFTETLYQITYFLCFAVDATVTISNVFATSDQIANELSDGKKKSIPIKIYYPSLPFSKETPHIDNQRMLFTFGQVRENAEIIINKWLRAYSTIRPVLGLYFSAATGTHKYLDGKFLALAQGLETYHRRTSSETVMENGKFRILIATLLCLAPKEHRKWLRGRLIHGNEINLGQRIKKIIEPYKSFLGSSIERNNLIRSVVNTRNYLTHYSEQLEKESAQDIDLWILCQKIEAIFQLHLLRQLGFSESEIQGILSNNYKLKQKIDGG